MGVFIGVFIVTYFFRWVFLWLYGKIFHKKLFVLANLSSFCLLTIGWYWQVHWEMQFRNGFSWSEFFDAITMYALCQFIWMINDSLRGKHE